jgi:O-antigen ligase
MNPQQPRWIAFAFGAAFALVPLASFAQKLGDTSHWPMHLASALLLAAFGVSAARSSSPSGSISWAVWASAGFALLALSSFWTTELFAASEARYATGRYLGYTAAALVGWRVGLRGIPILAWGLLGAGGIEALSALGDLVQNPKAMGDPYLAPGILGHKNFTSSAMALALPAAWYLWNRSQGAARNAVLSVAVLAVIAMVVLRTRSIWIGTALWTLFAVVRGYRSWKPLALGVALGTIVLTGVLARPKAREALMDPTNLRIREVFWGHSLQMMEAHPWTGVGAGQWRIHFPGFGLRGMNPSVAEGVTAEVRPHNDALWLGAEHGWPGIILWASLWIGLGLTWWRLRREDGADLVAGIALIVLTYSQFEFPIERAAVWIPLVLAAGMLRAEKRNEPISPQARWNRWIPIALMSALTAGYAWTAVQGMSSERDQEELLELNARQNAAALLPAATESLDEWTELDRFGNPSPYFAGMSAMFLEAQRAPITPTSFAEAEAQFKHSLELHPHHVVTWYQLANLYRYRGDARKAESTYRELLTRSPRHPGGQMHLAHALNAQNRFEEAAATLFSAFGDEAYYQQPDFRNATIAALRQCPDSVAMKGVQAVLNERANLDDNGLFARFLAEKSTWIGR